MKKVLLYGILLLTIFQLSCMASKDNNDALQKELIGKTVNEAFVLYKVDTTKVLFLDDPVGLPNGLLIPINENKDAYIFFDAPASTFSIERDWELSNFKSMVITDAAYAQ